MSKQQQTAGALSRSGHAAAGIGTSELPEAYRRAARLAADGQHEDARRLYTELDDNASEARLRALIANDLAALDAIAGKLDAARLGVEAALALDESCGPARLNLELLVNRLERSRNSDSAPFADEVGAEREETSRPPAESGARIRIAVVSFLFNWPSTGGGNVHTVELVTFLERAGYEVRHFYACYADWGIGRVAGSLPFQSDALEFDASSWYIKEIQARYRRAVKSFNPDYVIITDAWNMKPILAEAVQAYPYYLRFQALECLCPLNNLRLLARSPDVIEQCPRNQLATPGICSRCLAERGHHSGWLHQQERALCEVGTPEYDRKLRHALDEAVAVLVLNPLVAGLVEPYARSVRVVPWGMDSSRFPWPPPDRKGSETGRGPTAQTAKTTLFMAAVQGEFIKGYHVAQEACRLLRRTRSDFELVVTFDPPGQVDEFTRSVGWCSQTDLPRHYQAADIGLVPTIAQEGLSRTSVEAMASGIPVIASRIGGLPFTVNDGVTGLLFEPGDAKDLARQIARLLDDPYLRRQMGQAGRRRFEDEFRWETVIEKFYRPLFGSRAAKLTNETAERQGGEGVMQIS